MTVEAGAPIDVLLGHALFMALDPKQADKERPYPPLGTLYAGGMLRATGWRVALFDAMLAAGPEAFDAALADHRPRLVALFEDSFNFYSKMCLGRMRDAALAMVRSAAAAGVPVLVAGSDATDEPEPYLAAGATAVILGEGEHALADAVACLLGAPGASPDAERAARARLASVAGLALPGEGPAGVARRTPPRPPERDPDRFPPPARDLVDLDAYRTLWRARHGTWSLNAVSTRGCPFHCRWCAKPIWGQRYAMRAPEAVADELAELAATCAPDHVWFADDIFGLRPEWTAAFGDAVAARGTRLPFTIQTRVDLVTEAAADGLARAGCVEAWLGVESGAQAVLDAMAKGIRVDDVVPATGRLQRRGIRVGWFLQLGYPGEGWPEVIATRDLVRAGLPEAIGVSVSYPLPGTPFHARVSDQLGGVRHWSDSRDLAMLFAGTYTTAFYRRLRDLLHQDHEAALALATAPGGDPVPARDHRAGDRAKSAPTISLVPAEPVDPVAARRRVAAVERAWQRLAAREPAARHAAPTRLAMAPQPAAPDLSRTAN